MGGNSWQYPYDTGWIQNQLGGVGVADWANVHLGDNGSADSYVNHRLNHPLPDLMAKLYFASSSSDIDAIEIPLASDNGGAGVNIGGSIWNVDNYNLLIQTGEDGIQYISHAGIGTSPGATWKYRIKVWYIG